MGLRWQDWPEPVRATLRRGCVVPAHPLALRADRSFDADRQKALTRYYIDAGADGVAVGVHTTQFAIRDVGLYEPVLRIAAETVNDWADNPRILVAGVTGRTDQALGEIDIARGLGYHAALLNLARLRGSSEDEILEHCRRAAAEMPIIGFYMQTAVGGILLDAAFWERFAGIDNAVAIKVAPFDRYATLDVLRGVALAGAEERITLYTGNDDHIVADLLTPFAVRANGREVVLRFKGGLLGHWSVWTRPAVDLLARVHALPDGADVPEDLMALDSIVTDCNGAIYDALHDLRGCIPGCLEILRRQGLLEGIWCLDATEAMSPGQMDEIDRVCRQYPEMNDDAFVRANLQRWLADDEATAAGG